LSPRSGLTAAGRDEIVRALDQAGRGNPLLGVATGPIPGGAAATGLACAAGSVPADERPVAALVDAVAAWLGTDERRVAASMVVLGYAARLLGPGIAVLLREQILLDLRPRQVWYSYRPEQGFRLAVAQPAGWRAAPQVLRERWCHDVIDAHLRPVIANVQRVVPVAAGLLWGNVASGLAGALRALADDGSVPAGECHTTGVALLAHGPLHGTGELVLAAGRLRFTRRSCCLYYRLDGGGTCGDCPLPATSTRRTADTITGGRG